MRKNIVKSGDILEILLPSGLGISYGLYIDLIEILDSPSYPDLLYIFNYKALAKEEFNINKLNLEDLILSPQLIAGVYPLVRSGEIKVVANISLEDKKIFIPHFRHFEPTWATSDSEVKHWFYVENATSSIRYECTYEKVKHLEFFSAIGVSLLKTKIAMAFIIKEGKEVEDFFKLEEYYEKEFYRELISRPQYINLPQIAKGRAFI